MIINIYAQTNPGYEEKGKQKGREYDQLLYKKNA